MERFRRVLRRAERRLEGPEPGRSRILAEMAGDLEDLYRAYRDRGLDEDEARRRAEEWIAPSPGALESLRAVHLPFFDRLLDRLGGSRRGRVELALVTLASLLAVGLGVLGALRSGTLSSSPSGLWIVAGFLAGGLGLGLRQGYALFVRGDRLRGGWRDGVDRVLAAAVAAGLTGLLAGGLRLSRAGIAGDGGAGAVPWPEIATATGLAGLALSGALLLALLWLALRVQARRVRRARRRLRELMGPTDLTETRPQQEVAG